MKEWQKVLKEDGLLLKSLQTVLDVFETLGDRTETMVENDQTMSLPSCAVSQCPPSGDSADASIGGDSVLDDSLATRSRLCQQRDAFVIMLLCCCVAWLEIMNIAQELNDTQARSKRPYSLGLSEG